MWVWIFDILWGEFNAIVITVLDLLSTILSCLIGFPKVSVPRPICNLLFCFGGINQACLLKELKGYLFLATRILYNWDKRVEGQSPILVMLVSHSAQLPISHDVYLSLRLLYFMADIWTRGSGNGSKLS